MDQLLNIFTDPHHPEPTFRTPFAQGDYIYATDTRAIIRIRKSLLTGYYPMRENPDCAKLFSTVKPDPEEYIITPVCLRQALANVPFVDKTCDECGGDGEVDYSFDASDGKTYFSSGLCPICEGIGHIKGLKIQDPNAPLLIDDRAVFFCHIVKIADAADHLALKSIPLHKDQSFSGKTLYFPLADGIDALISCLSKIKTQKPIHITLQKRGQ